MTHVETLKMDGAVESILDVIESPLVGQPISRIEGSLKVSGQATYTAEYQFEGLLYGYLVSATIGKGKVWEINEETAKAINGVIAVIQDKKFLRNAQQGGIKIAPRQGVKKIAYHGQPIALIVASSYEAAREGGAALEVTYKVGHGAFDLIKELVHRKPINFITDKGETKNEPEEALAVAKIKVDSVYITPSQSNAAMEPHATIAYWEGDQLILYSALQMLDSCRYQLAHALNIKVEKVRIISRYIGGGFGSKLGISPDTVAAAIAAKQLQKPVKVVMTRPQVFESTVRRTNTRQRVALGANNDGTLHTIIHNSIVTNLPFELFYEPVAAATHFLYKGANRQVKYEKVPMNQVLAGSMRAPGEAVGMLGLECAMDELAEQLKMDPVDLRLKNLPEQDPSKKIDFSSRKLAEALQHGACKFGWNQRSPITANKREGEWLIGMGMASSARGNMLKPSQAQVTLTKEAKVIVETDMTDIGTGSYTILAQITADLLGLDLKDIEVKLGDTHFPPASGSGGSWGAASSGSSVYLACKYIRERIAHKIKAKPEDIIFTQGNVKAGTDTYLLTEILSEDLVAKGQIKSGKAEKEYTQASFGAQFAEVAVNAITGEIRVRRMLGVFSAGRILNEKTARSQCYGGMIFGLGGALLEELIHDPRDGRIVNHDLAEYHVPVNADIPPIEVEFLVERDELANPLHAKGLGELGISGSGAAIANAVYNATGIRIYDFPIRLDKLINRLPAI